jgi:hypothetical protein
MSHSNDGLESNDVSGWHSTDLLARNVRLARLQQALHCNKRCLLRRPLMKWHWPQGLWRTVPFCMHRLPFGARHLSEECPVHQAWPA